MLTHAPANMIGISVITCTHNPNPAYLNRVLLALKAQTLSRSSWEYILIDNASNEILESSVDLSWHPRGRHVREEQLGLTMARLRGIRESRGQLLVFVDDDNVLDCDYLEQALKISQEWPIIGAWSGQVRPDFEMSPPEWTKPYWEYLAIRSLERDRWSNLPDVAETMPYGAGMCVRRAVAAHYVHLHESGKRNFILDRAGTSLSSGGDDDLAACACDIGLGVGTFAALKLSHLIPATRLDEDYLVRLREGFSYSAIILGSFRSPVIPACRQKWSTKVADFLRLLFMNRRQRRFFRADRSGRLRACQHLSEMHAGTRRSK